MEFLLKALIASFALVAFIPLAPVSCSPGESNIADSSNSPLPGSAVGEPTLVTNPDEKKLLDRWDESATWKMFNSKLQLTWLNPGGDWIDAKGTSRGNIPFNTVALVDDDKPGPVDLDVTSYYLRTGRTDFFLRQSGGTNFVFDSREVPSNGPQLILDDGLALDTVADVASSAGTVTSLGQTNRLTPQAGFSTRC